MKGRATGQVGSEVKAAREKVALFDMTSFGKIRMHGSGALDLLQELGANNFDKPVGSVTYTQFLNPKGGIESDVTVTRLKEDEFRIISGTSFVSNVSYVAVFRQLSIPLGAIFGIVFLKEPRYLPKTIGITAIFLGLVLAGVK